MKKLFSEKAYNTVSGLFPIFLLLIVFKNYNEFLAKVDEIYQPHNSIIEADIVVSAFGVMMIGDLIMILIVYTLIFMIYRAFHKSYISKTKESQ